MASKRSSNHFSGPFLAVPRWVLPYLKGDGTTAFVLLNILQFLDSKQKLWCSYETIAETTGLSRSTVVRSMNKLIEIGVIVKKRRSRNGRTIPNEYYVNFNNPNTFPIVGVSPTPPLGVSPMTRGGVTHDTLGGVTHDTQTRINNKSNLSRRENLGKIDPRLMS